MLPRIDRLVSVADDVHRARLVIICCCFATAFWILPWYLPQLRNLTRCTMILLPIFVGLSLVGGNIAQSDCPGYVARNVQESASGFTADLSLGGNACDIYGTDIRNLKLTVEYQSATRLHVLIEDSERNVYQVPESVLPRPSAAGGVSAADSQLRFNFTEEPFSFSVSRSNGEVLFDTSGSPIIFESQYLGLRTSLPAEPNLYGLGEHSDHFRLNTTNYTRTIWSRDAYGIPEGTNLYGNHPIYVDHRGPNGTHAVAFFNSNGMDVKINDTDGQYLEYNVLGGVLDFYFVAGPSPVEVSQQLSDVVGKPALMAYWSFGFHQCRYGYQDVYQVAEVVYNYSEANIPLETMWTDIDYMDGRKVFTLDPERFPLAKVRDLVAYLQAHQQHYIVMVDPAVAYSNNTAFNHGRDMDIFLKNADGTIYQGVVWPGVTAFPDWFHPDVQDYWNSEFEAFFSPESGVDISGLWIDMNEAANFCSWPCANASDYAVENKLPPEPPPLRNGPAIELPGFPAGLQGSNVTRRDVTLSWSLRRQSGNGTGTTLGLPERELVDPPYTIKNAAGSLSNKTISTDLVHHNGLVEYDTHNLYGTMMSSVSREAMLSRRPRQRPLVITRSTFLGAGTYVGHWTGDNVATWEQYAISIASMLNFASIFQVPMVGSDVCGFAGNTTETLCARWHMLGAFQPFYRNHNQYGSIDQEAYRWPRVAEAARRAIEIRYRLMDYFYTAFYRQHVDGTPVLNPLFYLYPHDTRNFGIDTQFFYGDAVLVSPVLAENSTSVDIYLPDDIFYDWNNGFTPVRGGGALTTLSDVDFTTIPLHIRGGTIIPLRVESANTTAELRKRGFHILVAPGLDGAANGSLYLDDGLSIDQPATTYVNFTFTDGSFAMEGDYGFATDVTIESITILGVPNENGDVNITGPSGSSISYNDTNQAVTISGSFPLTENITFRLAQANVTGVQPVTPAEVADPSETATATAATATGSSEPSATSSGSAPEASSTEGSGNSGRSRSMDMSSVTLVLGIAAGLLFSLL